LNQKIINHDIVSIKKNGVLIYELFKKFKNLTLINVSHYKNQGIKYDKVFKISGKKIKKL